MKFTHDKTEYIIVDRHSDNAGIVLGYLITGLNNLIKNMLNEQIHRVKTVSIDEIDNLLIDGIENINAQERTFNWDYCEHLYLLRAYQNFTQKMKRVFEEYYIRERSVVSIADQENCSRRTIYDILTRCREEIELQKRLEIMNYETMDNH